MNISDKKIIIVTHYLVYGAPQALRDYLITNKIKKLLFIAHPLLSEGDPSYVEKIEKGVIKKRSKSKKRFKILFVNYFFDVYLTLKWILEEKEKFDLFVGVNCLNAFVGVILKKVKFVKKIVFYTIDYVPNRFDNKILNNIYHYMDKFCLKNADETWNVSPRIAEGREKLKGLKQKLYNRQKVVPIGVWIDRVKRLSFEKIRKHQLLFVGHLLEKQGIQLVLEAIPEIVKFIPDFHFLIIGDGNYKSSLVERAKRLDIGRYITFTGWIKNRDDLDKLMGDSALAAAIYNKELDSYTYYADPTKLKDYLSAGLPVILTDLSYNAKEIAENGCGVIVNYDKKEVAAVIINLMKDENKLKVYRENALKYIKQFDWRLIFENNLKRVLL